MSSFFNIFFAFSLRFFWLAYPPQPVGIESIHIESAKNYLNFGSFAPDNWHTPPLKKLLLFFSLQLGGDNTFGWRFLNALLGTLTVLFLFLISLEVFSNFKIAAFASLMLAIDPLHLNFSRTSFEDIPAAFFLTAATYWALIYFKKKTTTAFFTSVSLYSLGIATRWYVLLPFLVFFYFYLKEAFFLKKKHLNLITETIGYFLLLPVTIYLLTFLPWFTRGYSLIELLLLQKAMFIAQATVSLERFDYVYLLGYSYKAWQWYLTPISFGFLSKTTPFAVLITTNPFLSLLVLPSSFIWFKTIKTQEERFLFHSFLFLYLFFLFSPRPIFIYNSLATLPFACLAVALLFASLHQKYISYLYLTVNTLISLSFYPLITGIAVRLSLNYLPVINILKSLGILFITGID